MRRGTGAGQRKKSQMQVINKGLLNRRSRKKK